MREEEGSQRFNEATRGDEARARELLSDQGIQEQDTCETGPFTGNRVSSLTLPLSISLPITFSSHHLSLFSPLSSPPHL